MKHLAYLLVAYCFTLAGLSAATAPVAINATYTTPENTVLEVQLDSNAKSAPIYQVTVQPISGILTRSLIHAYPQGFSYTCAPGFVGTVTFQFTVTDMGLTSNPATGTIIVTANTAPKISNRHWTVNTGEEAQPVPLAYADPDGQTMAATLLTPPTHGTVVLSATDFRYTPTAGYVGPDSFRWQISDGLATAGPATVWIDVRAPTDRTDQVIEVVVNEAIYPEVKTEVDRLRDDLAAEGYTAHLVVWPAVSSVTALWNHFKTEYERTDQIFTGAILIGSLPKPSKGGYYNDLFYWNMDAPLSLKGKGTGSYQIWVSRIIADNSAYGSEQVLIKRALDANHACRTGRSRLPHAAYVYDSFNFTRSTDANKYLSLWPKVELRTETRDTSAAEKFLTRTDAPTGADALVAGGEMFDENSHGNAACYMNGHFATPQLFRFIAQQRVGLLGSCMAGAFGGIGNHHLFTRGGGLTWAVGATDLEYAAYALTLNLPERTRVRTLVAQGASWGRAFLDTYPFYSGDRTVFYGDLSMGVKMSPSNELPVVTAFTASSTKITTGSSATFNLTFTDADMAITSPYASYTHRIEWFSEGYDGGRKNPVAVQDLNGATTATFTHTFTTPGVYTARVEVIDAWQARGWKELAITVSSPPVAVADSATVTAGGTVIIPVLANDSDPDGGSLTLSTSFPAPAPLHGTRTVSGKSVIYTNTDRTWTGTETFGYTVGNGLTSSNGLVTVIVTGDVTPPRLVAVQATGAANQVTVIASEPLSAASAANPANYVIDHGITVTGAVRNPDTRSVTLTVSPALVAGTTYLLSVSNLQDTAAVPNTMATGSHLSFQYAPRSNGLAWDSFTGNGPAVPDFTVMTRVASGVTPNVSLTMRTQDLNFAVRFSGQIKIDTAGAYIFSTASDDGSQLFVDGALVVNNTANNMTQKSSASLTLTAGFHDLVLAYAQGTTATMGLQLWWQGPGIVKAMVPDTVLWHSVNTPPTITALPGQTMAEDGATGAIPFTVGDAESDPKVLTVSATTSNPTLLPVAQVHLGGSGTDRLLWVAPGKDQNGTATVTVRVSDGVNTTSKSFTVTVTAVNDRPVRTALPLISGITQVGQTLTALPGTWNDAADGGTIASYAYQWQRANNMAGSGLAAIAGATSATYVPVAADVGKFLRVQVTATDAGTPLPAASASDASAYTIAVASGANTAPAISAIANQTVAEDTATSALAVTVGDAQTAAASLTLSATSSNTTLVPVAAIVLSGSGANRSVTVTPAANRNGSATITVTVSDGSVTTSSAFTLTVTAVNDPPVKTVVPAITGTARVGQTLTASTGTWNDTADGGTIASYAYQWQRADTNTGTNLAAIAGATSATYLPVAADLGKFLRVQVTATDAGTPLPVASATAVSAYTSAITATPVISSQPASATYTVGQPAIFSVAATGHPVLAYQWQRLISGVWTAINGATATTYVTAAIVQADSGAQFRVVVSNGAGSVTSNAATLTVAAAGTLPAPWSTCDIGATGGSASYQDLVGAGEGLTVTGGGHDIWNTADAFRFAGLPLTGDGTIIARVVSQTNSNPWAKAGVMFRDSLTTGSRHAFAMVTPIYGVGFQRRTVTGGTSAHTPGSKSSAPRWVRLVRSGTTITAAESADGVTWTTIGSTSWPMGSTMYVGLAVTSHAGAALSTAVFDNVQILLSGPG